MLFRSFYRQGYREVLKLGWQAWRRGRRAESLVAADWEALLLRPLHEVRELLGVGEPPVYTPQFSAGALATR